MSARTLKIEDIGYRYRRTARQASAIRLKGRWLARAGFTPGGRVELVVTEPGVIQLRTVQQ